MSVEVNINYEGKLHCRAVHAPSNQALVTDAPVDNGGRGEAFSPTDLVATGLGACLLTILGLAGKRMGVDVQGTTTQVFKDMTSDPVRRIGSLRVTVVFPKDLALTPEQRAELEQAACICPVKQSLHPDVKVSIDFVYPA